MGRITPGQFFKLMKTYGVSKAEYHDADGTRLSVEMDNTPQVHPTTIPFTPPGLDEVEIEEEDIENHSAAMPRPKGVYEDPDLYPDGVDPVNEAHEYARLMGHAQGNQ